MRNKYKDNDWTLLLIDLKTGRTMEVDPDACRSRGYPEGYVNADEVTVEQWIDALQAAGPYRTLDI